MLCICCKCCCCSNERRRDNEGGIQVEECEEMERVESHHSSKVEYHTVTIVEEVTETK